MLSYTKADTGGLATLGSLHCRR